MLKPVFRLASLAIGFVVSLAAAAPAFAGDVYVQGYTRKDGTYVQPHYRTAPDSTINNNWSTQGNVNPYTGQAGTVPRETYGGNAYQGYGAGTSGNVYSPNPYSQNPYGYQPIQPYNAYGR